VGEHHPQPGGWRQVQDVRAWARHSGECSLNYWMFTESWLNVHWMFTECSLRRLTANPRRSSSGPEHRLFHWMFPECFLWMFTECSLNVPWIFPEVLCGPHGNTEFFSRDTPFGPVNPCLRYSCGLILRQPWYFL
jgi:hypothetical protein